jgi:hypothetical protein
LLWQNKTAFVASVQDEEIITRAWYQLMHEDATFSFIDDDVVLMRLGLSLAHTGFLWDDTKRSTVAADYYYIYTAENYPDVTQLRDTITIDYLVAERKMKVKKKYFFPSSRLICLLHTSQPAEFLLSRKIILLSTTTYKSDVRKNCLQDPSTSQLMMAEEHNNEPLLFVESQLAAQVSHPTIMLNNAQNLRDQRQIIQTNITLFIL